MPHVAKARLTPAALVVLLGAVIVGQGCGGSRLGTVPLSGRVTYKGQPLVGGTVTFHPVDAAKCRPATASIQPDGSFVAATLENDRGIMPGEYRVSVVLVKAPLFDVSPAQAAKAAANNMVLPPRYADPATSGLTVTIEAGGGSKTHDIDLAE
ncbi:MAG: hypothetical protein NTW96_19810 [Planctomycetia bacterium]|nr:hypothetical protein [Planctomycetia bacterium]